MPTFAVSSEKEHELNFTEKMFILEHQAIDHAPEMMLYLALDSDNNFRISENCVSFS